MSSVMIAPMRAARAAGLALLLTVAASLGTVAHAADPAVAFMNKVARELLTASRSRSPDAVATVIRRYADVNYIGIYSLGTHRRKLTSDVRSTYYAGMVRFIGRYAAKEAPKYPVARYQILSSVQGGSGLMVDSRIFMRDGSTYDVRWLLAKHGSTYRVRDAMVYGFWMTPFLRKLFEGYVDENGGSVKALVTALNR